MMKTRLSQILLMGQLALLVFYGGCNKNSSTGPGDNGIVIGTGSDYFPLTGNQTIIARATGQTVAYDSLGNIIQLEGVSQQEVKGFIGTPVVIGGVQSYPLYSFNTNGTTMTATKFYLAKVNNSIVGFAEGSSIVRPITALPSEIKTAGTWVANPSDQARYQVTMQVVDSKSSYTNSAGKAFANVIKVNGAFSDSTSTITYYDTTSSYTFFQKTKVNIDIYFAQGIGLVDIQINQFESTYKEMSHYSFSGVSYNYSYYSRTAISGTVGRTN